MQMQESKVVSSKALDASLVVTECSGTKSDEHITSSSSGTYITHVVDADIIPVNDQVSSAEVHLTAQHNVLTNEQQHTDQSKPSYDTYLLEKVDSNNTLNSTNMSHMGGEIDQDAEQDQLKSPLLKAGFLKMKDMDEKDVYNELSNRFLQLEKHCISLEISMQQKEERPMKMEHYIWLIQNYLYGRSYKNGNDPGMQSPRDTRSDQILAILHLLTNFARGNEKQVHTFLLWLFPEDQLARFHNINLMIKKMWDAIKTRFGGNAKNTGYKGRDQRTGKQEQPKALLTIDAGVIDWSGQAEEEERYHVMMVHSNSNSTINEEVCPKNYKTNLVWKMFAVLAEMPEEMRCKFKKESNPSKTLSTKRDCKLDKRKMERQPVLYLSMEDSVRNYFWSLLVKAVGYEETAGIDTDLVMTGDEAAVSL
ncbi:hypothetical protein Tco_0271298 [Tanacetum coccineum]